MRTTLSRVLRAGALLTALPACEATTGVAAPARAPDVSACASPAACEQRTAARMEAVRNDAAGLARFLGRFPKGGDLHNHVAGAVYAESYLGWAREDGLRIDGGFTLVDPSTCGAAGEVLRCGTPAAAPACDLTIRYLGQVGRTSPAPLVFA